MRPTPFGRIPATIILCVLGLSGAGAAADLQQKTVAAFNRYVAATEARFANEQRPGGSFLYIDSQSAESQKNLYEQLKRGDILVDKAETKLPGNNSEIPDGIVHHWVGLVFIPGATLAKVIPAVQDYDHRDELYKPDVLASRIVSHQGGDYKIFMRLYQKKFTTVVFNTDYDIHWGQVDAKKVYSNSYSTRIAQVKDAGRPNGEEFPVGKDDGYLWRLYTYWRFQEKDGGVYVQCEAVSLTRDIPTGLGWLLRPLVAKIPRESLNKVLSRTREVVQQQIKQNSTQQSALGIQPKKLLLYSFWLLATGPTGTTTAEIINCGFLLRFSVIVASLRNSASSAPSAVICSLGPLPYSSRNAVVSFKNKSNWS